MKRVILVLSLLITFVPVTAQAMSDAQLVSHLKQVYNGWRTAMIKKDSASWKRLTSTSRQVSVRNRIWSERRAFPSAVFSAPGTPPDINRLSAKRVRVQGQTAKAVYFGKVDFGVGGTPTDNVYVVSYVKEGTIWKYHEAEFVKLDVIPEVRKQLQVGNLAFVDTPDFIPNGVIPTIPTAIRGPVKYIAKSYVFCPGREVNVTVNGSSSHLYQNTKRSDIVIGGARDGVNEMKFTIKDIPGGDPKAAITVRTYLMSEQQGVQPIKIAEYQISDGSKPKTSGVVKFNVTPEIAARLRAR